MDVVCDNVVVVCIVVDVDVVVVVAAVVVGKLSRSTHFSLL